MTKIIAEKSWTAVMADGDKIVTTAAITQHGRQSPYFCITSTTYQTQRVPEKPYVNGLGYANGGGRQDELIAEYFPELAHYQRWNLMSYDGPMHYVANSIYHRKNGEIDLFYRSCVFGALESDKESYDDALDGISLIDLDGQLDATQKWLEDRLSNLIELFAEDMKELFYGHEQF